MPTSSIEQHPLAALRRFARARPARPEFYCGLCGKATADEHRHLFDPAARQLYCACSECAVLFSGRGDGRFREVPRHVERLPNFQMTDLQWEDLNLPIELAFLFQSSAAGHAVACYPSPAGAVESSVPPSAWEALKAGNPALENLKDDVEALMIHRLEGKHAYFRMPIDQCYKLVGVVRSHWRGLAGGPDVWTAVHGFFDEFGPRAGLEEGNSHAGPGV